MLTKVELRIPGDSVATNMDVVVPNASTRYLVKNIEGLGPVKADVSSSNLAYLDGSSIDHVRTSFRNIVIDFEYRPDFASGQTVYSLRQSLYQVAGPKRSVELTFVIQGVGTRKIVGTVESIESPMFSKELTGQLSVICPNPYFIGASRSHTLVPTVNEYITYEGDVPTGVMFAGTLSVLGRDLRFQRHHPSTGWERLQVADDIAAGQGLMFNTKDREKYAKLWSGANLIPRLNQFDWWKLYPGQNSVLFTGQTSSGNYPAQGTYTVEYDVLYGGL